MTIPTTRTRLAREKQDKENALKAIAYLKMHLERNFDNLDNDVLRETRALNKTIKTYYGG